jgi:hypothetical protein
MLQDPNREEASKANLKWATEKLQASEKARRVAQHYKINPGNLQHSYNKIEIILMCIDLEKQPGKIQCIS